MRNPESITVNEDARLIPMWSIVAAVAAFVLVEYYFWVILPQGQNPYAAARPPHLLRYFLRLAGLALLPDGGLRQPGRAAAGDERALLDGPLLRDAGRHRRGALLSAAPAGGIALPGLLDARAERLPLLSAVQLSACSQLRTLLPDSASLPTNSAPAAAMSWPRTTCRRGCG